MNSLSAVQHIEFFLQQQAYLCRFGIFFFVYFQDQTDTITSPLFKITI